MERDCEADAARLMERVRALAAHLDGRSASRLMERARALVEQLTAPTAEAGAASRPDVQLVRAASRPLRRARNQRVRSFPPLTLLP